MISRPPNAPSGLPRIIRTAPPTRAPTPVWDDTPWLLSEPNPWVEEAVDDVDQQVQHDDAGRQEQVDALDDGVVAPGDGVEQELPHAGQDEDALHDDGPAEERRELEAHHRDHGDHGVLQDVSGDDQRLRQALRPRRPDVIL